jgi:arsenate reductase
MSVTIYHNPACGTSRNTLAMIRKSDPKWTDDALIDVMLAHPILINRPIVVTPLGTRLCRPSESVLEILPNPDIGPFTKEDGEVVPAKPRKAAR